MIPVSVVRHFKERRSKCSLTPLEGREDMVFFRARPGWTFDMTGFILLGMDGPVLSEADAGRPLLLPDSTWRLLPQIEACLVGEGVRRTLPPVETAYPRRSQIAEDPMSGLASVEALYLAKWILGERDDALLAGYYWSSEFMENLKKAAFFS